MLDSNTVYAGIGISFVIITITLLFIAGKDYEKNPKKYNKNF